MDKNNLDMQLDFKDEYFKNEMKLFLVKDLNEKLSKKNDIKTGLLKSTKI